jgi:hypothetical protein
VGSARAGRSALTNVGPKIAALDVPREQQADQNGGDRCVNAALIVARTATTRASVIACQKWHVIALA